MTYNNLISPRSSIKKQKKAINENAFFEKEHLITNKYVKERKVINGNELHLSLNNVKIELSFKVNGRVFGLKETFIYLLDKKNNFDEAKKTIENILQKKLNSMQLNNLSMSNEFGVSTPEDLSKKITKQFLKTMNYDLKEKAVTPIVSEKIASPQKPITPIKHSNSNLKKFKDAQEGENGLETYQQALKEIKNGKKTSHWIWYIFPQIQGLGVSTTSKYYEIKDIDEAKDYLKDEVLGKRLIEITKALLIHNEDIRKLVGNTDYLKLKSSMTLFSKADPTNPVFKEVLDKFYNGNECVATSNMLKTQEQKKTGQPLHF